MADKGLTIQKEGELTPEKRRLENWLTPAVDIFENEEGVTLLADLPGVNKDGLNIGVDQDVLTIEGDASLAGEGETRYREFGATGYYRRFQLPDNVDMERVDAKLKDGVLTVKMPKKASARPRRIEVTVH